MNKPRLLARKLLVASVGVAAVSYAACSTPETSGNLMAPDDADAQTKDAGEDQDAFVGSGNLMPPPPRDAGSDADAPKDAADDAFIGSGNLVPPPLDPDQ